MPRLNRRGQAAMGIGDAVASIDGVIVAGTLHPTRKVRNGTPEPDQKAGGTMWVDDDTALYQTYAYESDGHAVLETYHVPTGKKTRVSNIGANHGYGGGGRWIAWLGEGGVGTYDSANQFRNHHSVPVGSSRDGAFAIRDVYHSDFGTSLYAADGRVTRFPDDTLLDLHVIGPTSAIWVNMKDGLFRTMNARIPKQVGHGRGPTVLILGEKEEWVMYWNDDNGLIVHPFDELEGYVLETSGHAFNHDAVVVDGRIVYAYSLSQGEAPWELVKGTIDMTQPRVKFKTSTLSSSRSERVFTESASGSSTGVAPTSLVQAQLGLLEDDIVYRLALLATNVLQPLKNKYPNIVVKSGFRQVNTGISQHELGEAVDIQIINQTPRLLYEVAHYISTNLQFDQLVLNFSNVGDKQPWIHVSFSPNTLRGQVLTKDFADVFYEGLYLVTPQTGEEAAAVLREQGARDARILSEMTKLQKRQERLITRSQVSDEPPPAPAGGTSPDGTPGGGTGSGSGNVHGRAKLVKCVQDALALPRSHDEATNIANAFEIVKRVAWLLRDEGCGLLIKNGGENIISWNGYSFSAGRVCFSDGQLFKILTDVEGGTHAPTWDDNGIIDQQMYVAAMDPGSSINMNWLQCKIGDDPTAPAPPAHNPGPGGGGNPDDEGGGNGGREA